MTDRRSFMGYSLAAGVLAPRICTVMAADAPVSGPVVTTSTGKIRGVADSGVNAFKGIPYGASTAGAGRFQPPAKPKPWTGVRDATQLGHRSPQLLSAFHGVVPPEVEVMDRDEPMGEDCLVLNVWTPTLERASKLPVMVWLHGGGFTSGSGGFICYDGTQLAKKHDVVVVTVNHRLTAFGYLYLAGLGAERFANTSNLGNLDIIAALEWVRDNIATFGADPGNVTIFGQSGGGGKVSSLMAMPAAHGLFKRAIAQSGAAVKGIARDAASANAERFLGRLNLKPNQADQLLTLSMDQLLKATEGSGPPIGFGPVVDGKTLPTDPFDPIATPISGNIPMMIGTVETEVTFFPNQQLEPMDDATFHGRVKQLLRTASDADVERVIAAYRKGRPDRANTDLWLIMSSDATFRAGILLEGERKAEQTQSPMYEYYFTWRSPVRQGKLRTFHTLEIPFVFDNVDNCQSMTGSGADRQPLADKMSAAWVAFARTGNPNHPGLKDVWVPYDNVRRATMVFNDKCELLNDPYGSEQRLLRSLMGRA